nr:MAG TPA: hypothetical protein [Caudoviricetes sp.]
MASLASIGKFFIADFKRLISYNAEILYIVFCVYRNSVYLCSVVQEELHQMLQN